MQLSVIAKIPMPEDKFKESIAFTLPSGSCVTAMQAF
jgi:hypothetical protein